MAYNQYYNSPHPGGMNPYGGEELAEEIHPRYSADPFSNQQPYSSLPLSQDPEMVDLSSGQRPLSGVGSDTGSSSAYWAPGRSAAAGGAAGAGAYGLGEDWDDGQDSWWRRRRWLVIAAICGLIAALAIGLGVGLGVGLNNSKKNDNAARLSDSKSSSDRPTGSSHELFERELSIRGRLDVHGQQHRARPDNIEPNDNASTELLLDHDFIHNYHAQQFFSLVVFQLFLIFLFIKLKQHQLVQLELELLVLEF
ncbi:hypothetical protein NBRC10512v2_005732 [Rhodotorula toruloides]